jgi:hypothetical protein
MIRFVLYAFSFSVLALFFYAPLAAQPSSIEDCESIANSLAYNQCLASFGPKQGERKTRSSARMEDDGGARPVNKKTRSSSGRKTATFDVITEDDDVPLSTPDPDNLE